MLLMLIVVVVALLLVIMMMVMLMVTMVTIAMTIFERTGCEWQWGGYWLSCMGIPRSRIPRRVLALFRRTYKEADYSPEGSHVG